jgi:hypothetical protein
MAAAGFHLVSRWRVKGAVDDVYGVIDTPLAFTRWWSAVYLSVEEVDPGDANGIGRTLDLRTKGLLPYTLRWRATATETERPRRLVIEARGDLEGTGVWQFRQAGDWVEIDYDWTVAATKPWMARLAPLLKPVFAANHRWAMRQGLRGLEQELLRLRGSKAAGPLQSEG